MGAWGYLAKPVDAKHLLLLSEEVLTEWMGICALKDLEGENMIINKNSLMAGLLLGITGLFSIDAVVTWESTELLQNRSFVCRSISVSEGALTLPEFFKDQKPSDGRVEFQQVDSSMVKVLFIHKIGGGTMSHTYHLTHATEHHSLGDIILTEGTEITDFTEMDPYKISIGTTLKIKRKILTGRVNEIWIRKRMDDPNKLFDRKDIKCRVNFKSGKPKKPADASSVKFQKLYR